VDSGFAISRCARVLVFSDRDKASITLAGDPPGNLPIEVGTLAGGEAPVSGQVREEIEAELRGIRAAKLDFDAVRPRAR